MKLSLTMIAKNELTNLERLYPLVKDYIDEWVVVVPPRDSAIPFLKGKATVIEQDFTQAIEPEIIDKFKEYGLDVDKDYRLFNFVNAREASLAAATGDFVLWLDADDIPLGMDNIKKFIEKNKDVDVFNAVYDYARDEEGNSVSDHIRERVIRNNGRWQWLGGKLGLIHETLLPIEPYAPMEIDFPDEVFRVEHHSDHINESSMRNHIALLYEYIKTNGYDPRTTLYLGIEFFNRGMYDYCVKVLLEYVKVGGSIEDRYNAWIKIGEAYHMIEDRPSGRNAYLEAQKEMPNRPDSYIGLGESYFDEQEWVKAVEYLMTGLGKKLPSTKQAVDRIKYTFRPSGYIALAYLELGKPGDAFEWFVRTAKLNPKHPWVKQYAPLFLEAKDLDDYVKSFVKLGQISQKRYPRTLSKIAEIVPDELKDQELLMDFKWRYTRPKIWEDNTVVFFCSHAFEDWGPESLKNGCGGSEEAVIQLSKRLVKLGWEVTIYNNCIQEKTVDGVKWVRFERFNPRDMFNILVSWRNNMFIDARTASKKYIDMHDVPNKAHYTEESTEGVKILVKSQYHRETFNNLKDDSQFIIIPNGIDPEQFKDAKKIKNNLVWTSSYDRGLEPLLEMWGDVLKEVPNATIDVAYGFNLYDTAPWGKTAEGRAWKQKMLKLLDQPGVTHHGRIGTNEVAELYKKADVWAYPTNFPEISCITAMKAQAAGCRILTSGFAALPETIIGKEEKLDINNQKDREKFKAKLISLLKTPRDEEEIQKLTDAALQKYDWTNIAQQWHNEFNEGNTIDQKQEG